MTTTKWTSITAERVASIDDEHGLTFLVPGQNQGQIVEVSYAGCPEGIIERTYDRSDRSESYRMRDWRDDDEESPGLNRAPA